MAILPQFYVYVLLRPNGTPFYVGKGKGRRVFGHENEARRGCDCYKCRVIRKIWRDGGEVQRCIVFTTDNEQVAFDYERETIALHGRDNLTNLTDGGDGASGAVRSEQSRARVRAWSKRLWQDPVIRAKMSKGHTPESRAKMSAVQTETWANPEIRARRIRGGRAANATPEARANHSAASKAVHARPEYHEALTERSRQLATDPEHCRKVSDGLKAALASPEARAKHSAAARARWADPVYRATQVAAAKARWESPEARAKQSMKLKGRMPSEATLQAGATARQAKTAQRRREKEDDD